MGYETNLLFVGNYTNFKGYCLIVASLDVCKVGYGATGKLMQEARQRVEDKPKLLEMIKAFEAEYNFLYNSEGNYSDEANQLDSKELNALIEAYYKSRLALEKLLPFVRMDGKDCFTDKYGDLLMVVSLSELRDAIIKDNSEFLSKDGATYRRFDAALKLIDAFRPELFGEEIKVIMWGY